MQKMEFRRATLDDLAAVQKIYAEGRRLMREKGIPQWLDGYPDAALFTRDVEEGISWLLVVDGEPAVTAALAFGPEADYAAIYNGAWLCEGPYSALHRLGAADNYRHGGYASALCENLENVSREMGMVSLRNDTHRKNHNMQRFLQRRGFRHCGTITISDGTERLAFEKIL